MRTILLWLFIVIVAPWRSSLAGEYIYPGDRQWIYCAEGPEECFLYCTSHIKCPKPDTMFLFIRAADSLGVTRAHFRLEVDYPGCDSILSVAPCPGVTIESGDILNGMTISFPLIKMEHFKALTLVFRNNSQEPPPAYSHHGFWIREAWLERSNAETVTLLDYGTQPYYPDCYMESLRWYHPDTVDVYIGSRTDVRVQWALEGPYYFGIYVNVIDEKSWVSGYTPNGIDWTGCGTCPWDIETLHIYVEVPRDTPEKSLSTLTITRQNGSPLESFVLRAVPPVATRKTSWGTLKNLFK